VPLGRKLAVKLGVDWGESFQLPGGACFGGSCGRKKLVSVARSGGNEERERTFASGTPIVDTLRCPFMLPSKFARCC
jgi:hypothetical protein